MGCLQSKSSFTTTPENEHNSGDGIDEVLRLINKLHSSSLDVTELKQLLTDSLPKLLPIIDEYMQENKKPLSKIPDELLLLIKDYLVHNIKGMLDYHSELSRLVEISGHRLKVVKLVMELIINYEESSNIKKLNKAKRKLDKYPKKYISVAKDIKIEEEQTRQKLTRTRVNLRQWRIKIERKLKLTKKWKKVYDVGFKTLFVGVLACAVILASLHCPVAAITGATVGGTIVGSMKAPLDMFWKKKMKVLEAEEEVVMKMTRNGGLIEVHEFDTIRLDTGKMIVDMDDIAEKMKFEVKRMMEGVDGVEEIERDETEKKIEELEASIGEVKKKVNASLVVVQNLVCELLKCMVEGKSIK